jgi:hypothetical protein
MRNMAKNNGNDFDPDALAQTADEHTKSISSLHNRVGTNENFGKTFAKAAKDSKQLELALRSVFVNLLKNDTDTQGEVKKLVKSIDKREFWTQLSTFGKIVGWLITIVVSGVIGAVIQAHIK